MKLTKLERISAVVKGEKPDRLPVSFWRHFYERETSAEGLAEAMLGFQREFDWDFMKLNPRACYHFQVWGASYKFSGDPHTSPVRLDYPVKDYRDLERLKVMPPDKGPMGEQLKAIRIIRKELPSDVLLVETIFSPLSIAADLAESYGIFKEYLKRYPEIVHKALKTISDTFADFASMCMAEGARGIFFATRDWASFDMLSVAEYREFGKPYDLKVLDAVKGNKAFNILHICKKNNMLKNLADYPVSVINWDASESTNPDLAEGKKFFRGAVAGGIDHKKTLVEGSVNDLIAEAEKACTLTAGERWILAPGCSISTKTPSENLHALRSFAESIT